MVEYTLLEKIKATFNLVFSSPLFLILLIGFALMAVDVFFISKKSKTTKIVYMIISILIIGLLLKNYFNSFFAVLDTIAKNIVAIIYFPSVLEYILMILATLIIILISLIVKKTNKRVKTINLIVFFINMFLFFLILDIISKNNIDLSNKISIYSNQSLMILFELSMLIFIVWVVGLIIYKIIKKIIYKGNETNNFYEEPELPKTLEELRKEELAIEPKIEYIVVEKEKEDLFTLEDYREMKKLLEQIKQNQKEKENDN